MERTKREMQTTQIEMSLWDLLKLSSKLADTYGADDMTKGEMKQTMVQVTEWDLAKAQA